MSYLRDAKLIKTIAENENSSELSEEACRYILADTELVLRRLISETAKITRRFNRSKAKPEDVDIVLDSMNLAFLAVGTSSHAPNVYVRSENSNVELDQTPILIKDKIAEILRQKLVKKRRIEVSFSWLFVNGKMNPQIEKSLLPARSVSEARVTSAAQLTSADTARFPFQEFTKYDYLTEKNTRAVYLIKEVNPDVITRESFNFLSAYRETLEFYFQKIDDANESIDFKRLNYSFLISAGDSEDVLEDPDSDPFLPLLHQSLARLFIRTSRL